MKKVIAQAAKWGPLALSALCTVYLMINVVSGYRITPHSEWGFCLAVAGLYLLITAAVFTDKTKSDDKIKHVGCGILPILTLAALCSLTYTVNSFLALGTSVVVEALTWVCFVKGTQDTGFTRLFKGLSLAALVFLAIFCLQPVTSGRDSGRSAYGSAYGENYVAFYSVKPAVGNKYKVKITVNRAGADLGFATMVGIDSTDALSYETDRADYKTPEIVWEGDELVVNGKAETFILE